MRNIRFVGLIQRLNCLNKSTNVLSRASVYSPASLVEQEQKRFSSSSSSFESSNHNSSGYAGALIGAALFGTLAYQINENWKKNILLAKETDLNDRIDDFLIEAKHKVDEVKALVEDVKEVVDETIEIGKELEKVGDELVHAEEVVEKVLVEMEHEIDAVVHEIVSGKIKGLEGEEKAADLPEIPNHVQYLIVGGGTAAMSAFKSIRALDANARVLVVTEEEYKPYMRPPLSKDLWLTDDQNLVKEMKFKQFNGNERSVFFLDDEFYVDPKLLNQQENGGVAILTGKRVTKVDVDKKVVRLDNDWEIGYDKCLIATGGKPRTLDAFKSKPEQFEGKVTLFRNIKDFEKLLEISKQGKHIAIVGGGFLGSELACALAYNAKKHGGKVTQVFPETGNLGKVLPEYLTKWTTKKVVEEGVKVVPNARIIGAQINDNKVELQFTATDSSNGLPACNWLLADHVVVAVGLEPNVELAINSGFEVDNTLGGFTVNTELQARNSVWVAGDAACFYDTKLGRRRVEHHDHAVVSGRLAGENMTGAGKPYWHQSMFWSDIGPNIGFEAIGLVDSSLQTVGLFAKADESDKSLVQCETPDGEEFGKGVVLYLKNDVVVGCLMWNLFRKVPIARELITSQEKVSDFKEIAKLFQINTVEKTPEE